jgi:hypothetical protein
MVKVFIVEEFIVEAFPTGELPTDMFARELDTNPLTHAVVGTLEELSEMDKDAFIFGFVKKVAVDAFKIEVFVVVA